MDIKKILALANFICSRSMELNSYITKTKLLKILYLIDIEYYRKHNSTFTEFSWIYYDYGPWAYEYIKVYNEIESSMDFIIDKIEVPRVAEVIRCPSVEYGVSSFFPDPLESISFRYFIDHWIQKDLNEILNHVYFYTEPMEGAEKHKRLDFSKINSLSEIPKFKLEKSDISKKQKEHLKKIFFQKTEAVKSCPTLSEIKHDYDEIYWDSIEKMDFDSDY